MNKVIAVMVLSGMVLSCSELQATQPRGLFDVVVDVAGYIYESGYNNYAADVDVLFDDIVREMSLFSRFFSPVHDTQLADMRRALVIVDREWPVFLHEHEYTYGLFITDMINLRATLIGLLNAMRQARVSSRLLYDYELETILDYLEGIVYEIRNPIFYIDSIARISNSFAAITSVITRL